jgi:hypothetical protein
MPIATIPIANMLFNYLPIVLSGISVVASVVIALVLARQNEKHAREIEELKAENSYSTRLREKQAEVVAEMIRWLVEIQSLTDCAHVGRPIRERPSPAEVSDEFRKCRDYYRSNRHHINSSLWQTIDSAMKHSLATVGLYKSLQSNQSPSDPTHNRDNVAELLEQRTLVDADIAEIEKELQSITGISDTPKAA